MLRAVKGIREGGLIWAFDLSLFFFFKWAFRESRFSIVTVLPFSDQLTNWIVSFLQGDM